MLNRQRTLAAIVLSAAVASAPAAALARGSSRQVRTPTITARPDSAMINTEITVRGRGFPHDATVRLRECGRTSWLDPRVPCDVANEVTLTSGQAGSFATSFKVELCPEGEPIEEITQRRCYIGVPVSGEDTGALQPYLAIAVSYP